MALLREAEHEGDHSDDSHDSDDSDGKRRGRRGGRGKRGKRGDSHDSDEKRRGKRGGRGRRDRSRDSNDDRRGGRMFNDDEIEELWNKFSIDGPDGNRVMDHYSFEKGYKHVMPAGPVEDMYNAFYSGDRDNNMILEK